MAAPLFPSLDAGRSIIGRTPRFTLTDGSTVTGDVLGVTDLDGDPGFLLGTFGLPDVDGFLRFADIADYRIDGSFLGGFYIGVD